MLYDYVKEKHPKAVTSPFYTPKKPFDVQVAGDILVEFCGICERVGLNYRVIFGTLLGIYRDGDLIEWDADTDLGLHAGQEAKLVECIPEIVSNGYTVERVTQNVLVSFGKHGHYLDVYLYSGKGTLKCSSYSLPDSDFKGSSILNFRGTELKTVPDPEGFIVSHYGKDWKTPKRGCPARPQ